MIEEESSPATVDGGEIGVDNPQSGICDINNYSEDSAFLEAFEEFKDENRYLFPDIVPIDQQYKVYLSAIQVRADQHEKKVTISTGTIHVPDPHRVWKIPANDLRLQDQTSAALDALSDINTPPFVFHRARSLVRINYDEKGMPLIEQLSESGLRGIIERCCEFQKISNKGIGTPIPPPLDVIKDIQSLPEWNSILPLAGIIECPCILKNNTLICNQGYDKGTRLYYAPPPGFTSPVVPDHPSKKDIDDAVKLLKEIFCDFPFIDDASRTNTIATLICSVLRPMIEGAVPMFLINKPQAGTGASLIADCIAIVATGKPASVITAPENDTEWRKKITSTLKGGRTLAFVDNIEYKLHSPSLAALLTAKIWEDRDLGYSRNVSFPHRMQWIGTGNNIQLGGDLPRRCYMANLNAEDARPWQRDDNRWTHPRLLEWVSNNRSRIVEAILVLARSWILAGQPEPGKGIPKTGGFEEWRSVIGGIVGCAGLKNFLGNLEEMYTQSDADTPQWELFFERWFMKWNDTPITIAEIVKYLRDCDNAGQQTFSDTLSLLEVLPDSLLEAWNGKKSFSRVFGNRLAKMKGTVFVNGYRLEKCGIEHQAVTWKVTPAKKGELAK